LIQAEYGWTTEHILSDCTIGQVELWAEMIAERRRRDLLNQAQVMRIAFAAVMSKEGAEAFEKFAGSLSPSGSQSLAAARQDKEFSSKRKRLDPAHLPDRPEPNPAIVEALKKRTML